MISITKSQVPAYLRKSEFYHSLDDDEDEIQIPEHCFKTNLTFVDSDDLRQMLSTLRFWCLTTIPSELVEFFIFNKIDESNEVFIDFEGELVYLSFLRTLSNYPANSAGKADFSKYHNGLKRICSDDPLVSCATLCCLQYEYTNGVTWNAETCSLAAEYGTLSMLQWLREHGCPWDSKTSEAAAGSGKLEVLRYSYDAGCPWRPATCAAAASGGHLNCLKYAHENGCPWGEQTCIRALSAGYKGVQCFEYAQSEGCPWGAGLCAEAARVGDLTLLRQLHENGCPWDASTCSGAAIRGQLKCLQYARENGCPWDGETCYWAAWMNYMSILTYAHEHGCPWDAKTCTEAAGRSLSCLKYAHENGCPWDGGTCANAALFGDVTALAYAHEHGCPWDTCTTTNAASSGKLSTLRYAHEHGCPWGPETCARAAEEGRLACLVYAHENGCPWDERTCAVAAKSGHLACVKYAHQQGCPWDAATCSKAAAAGNFDCLQYAHKNGCPWDSNTCTAAVKAGELKCLTYAHEHGCALDGALFEYARTAASRRCIEYAKQHKCYPRLRRDPSSCALLMQVGDVKQVVSLFTAVSTAEPHFTYSFEDTSYVSLATPQVPVVLHTDDFAQIIQQGGAFKAELTSLDLDAVERAGAALASLGFVHGARAYSLQPADPAEPTTAASCADQRTNEELFDDVLSALATTRGPGPATGAIAPPPWFEFVKITTTYTYNNKGRHADAAPGNLPSTETAVVDTSAGVVTAAVIDSTAVGDTTAVFDSTAVVDSTAVFDTIAVVDNAPVVDSTAAVDNTVVDSRGTADAGGSWTLVARRKNRNGPTKQAAAGDLSLRPTAPLTEQSAERQHRHRQRGATRTTGEGQQHLNSTRNAASAVAAAPVTRRGVTVVPNKPPALAPLVRSPVATVTGTHPTSGPALVEDAEGVVQVAAAGVALHKAGGEDDGGWMLVRQRKRGCMKNF